MAPKISGRPFNPGKFTPMHTEQKKTPKNFGSSSKDLSLVAKTSNMSSPRDLSYVYVDDDMISKTTTASRKCLQPAQPTFYSKLISFVFRETTKYPCKCSEQDRELDCCSKAGEWVRMAESRRNGKPDMDKYTRTYRLVVNKIERMEDDDPDMSLNTTCLENYNNDQEQIIKDIERTLVNHEYFGKGKDGQATLHELLKILARRDTHLGYVQGMNFLAAALLYH